MIERKRIRRFVRDAIRLTGVLLAEDDPSALIRTADRNAARHQQQTTPRDVGEEIDTARASFEKWRRLDPFPEIPPALLNSADIDDYMRQTAMVVPYNPILRKSASYALKVGSEIAYWDPAEPDQPPIKTLSPGNSFIIPSNSLVYVTTKEIFQLPDYIAVRFNLHIDLVHKGLLLGTGPLVDPGFVGRLMVPLHNLTNNEYVLAEGDEFIWVEFTKTSLLPEWKGDGSAVVSRQGSFAPFPELKTKKSMADYIEKARRGHPVLQPGLSHQTLQNAIPDAIERTRKTADSAKINAAKAKRSVNKNRATIATIGFIALVGAAATLFSQIQAGRSALQTTLSLVDATNGRIQVLDGRIKQLEMELDALRDTREGR